MKNDEKASVSLKKIITICLILICILGISVIAGNTKLNSVKIKFSNNHEITVLTSKTKISEILKDNNIILASNEVVTPELEAELTQSNTIIISLLGDEPAKASEVLEEISQESIAELKQQYENITEEIITVSEEIPFETITKDVSNGGDTSNKVIQAGKNGIREVTYKVTYKDGIEIYREELESHIIKEPVNRIVQIQTKATITSRSGSRVSGVTTASSGKYKVTAYCACAKCCGKTNGITASGRKATANHTVAAPSSFAFGTKLVINGKTYVVEDRGGAIQGNRIDIYMNSHSDALAWGVRYVNVDVVQ